jgi:hypothetical protein
MKLSADLCAFLDFLRHPRSSAIDLISLFDKARTLAHLDEVIAGLLKIFQVSDADNSQFVSALVVAALGGELLPTVKADGTGNLDSLDYAFELFTCDDPFRLLAIIHERIDGEQAVEAVRKAGEALAGLTTAWREVLRFGFDAAVERFVPEELRAVREAIGMVVQES